MRKRNRKVQEKSAASLFWMLTAVGCGIFAGLFFGESCSHLKIVGQAFIALMQVCVLPYILVALVRSLGSLEPGYIGLLARRGLIILLVLWGIVFTLLTLMPLCFPNWQFSSFFSQHLIEPTRPIDYISLFIPANLFHALANNIVPAVTVFSILFGAVLMRIPNKRNLLDSLDTVIETLTGLNRALLKLSPVGIFALVANAAGEMRLSELGRLEVYLIAYFVMGLILFFLVLPLLLSAFTPFRYREIMRVSRNTMLMVPLVGNPLIVLPQIVENIKSLFRLHDLENEENVNLLGMIAPIVFMLPCAGQLLDLLFILFAGWHNQESFGIIGHIKLYGVGLLTTFGRSVASITLLLNMFKLPADMNELFQVSSVITDNIRSAVEAVTVFCFSAFFVTWVTGAIRWNWPRLLNRLTIMTGGSLLLLFATNWFLGHAPQPESKRSILDAMTLTPSVEFSVFNQLPDSAPPCRNSRLEQITRTGVLRVGFNAGAMPFAFFNDKGQLLGFDIAMAHLLAADLGCKKIEFYPVSYDDLVKPLNENLVDIIMGQVSISAERLGKIAFTDHYMELSKALLLPDYLKQELVNHSTLPYKLTVAAMEGADILQFHEIFPEFNSVKITSTDDFFNKTVQADALMVTAENGAIRTILHPEYDLYIPKRQRKDLIAYAIAHEDMRFLEYLNFWLTLKQLNGEIERQYDYWIRGVNVKPQEPRWSILHNVILRNKQEPDKD